MSGLEKDIRTTARPIAARVVQKAPAAYASRSKPRASHARDKSLRGQRRVRASSAQARLHRRANSAENEIISALKKPWIKVADSKVGSSRLRARLRHAMENAGSCRHRKRIMETE